MAAEPPPWCEFEDGMPRHRWWESMAKVLSDYEQVQTLKVATACSGIESPITAAKAEVIISSFKVL